MFESVSAFFIFSLIVFRIVGINQEEMLKYLYKENIQGKLVNLRSRLYLTRDNMKRLHSMIEKRGVSQDIWMTELRLILTSFRTNLNAIEQFLEELKIKGQSLKNVEKEKLTFHLILSVESLLELLMLVKGRNAELDDDIQGRIDSIKGNVEFITELSDNANEKIKHDLEKLKGLLKQF